MYESSLRYLKCVNCGNDLELLTFENKNEVVEGILACNICYSQYPIISSIPFLLKDLTSYFSIRAKLGGYLMLKAKNRIVKSIISKALKEIKQVQDDTTDLEINWINIYKKSKRTKLESKIPNILEKLPSCNSAIEHGCSMGKMSQVMSNHHDQVFGIDKSFFALIEAKKRKIKNADFFVADSLAHPFANKKFDLVMALNILELIEPLEFLEIIDIQASKFIILSDPYDYERGKYSVKTKLDESSLRLKLIQMGFELIMKTKKPDYLGWKLQVNPRLELNYKVDLIVAKKLKTLKTNHERR